MSISLTCAFAQEVDVSANFSLSETKYSATSTSSVRRHGVSFGYNFFSRSEIEAAWIDATTETKWAAYESNTFHDTVLSLNLVQNFFSYAASFQPFVKCGIGSMVRQVSGVVVGSALPDAGSSSLTGVLGVGFRFRAYGPLSFRFESVTYLTEGVLSTYKDNFGVSFGLGLLL